MLARTLLICCALLECTSVSVRGQVEVAPRAEANLFLGSTGHWGYDRSLLTGYRTKPLENSTPLVQGLHSGYYVSQVGGIAFDQVAKPAAGVDVRTVELVYDSKEPDGLRLSVTLNGRNLKCKDLPDWQLMPIASFSDSPYPAVVTLFGELGDHEQRPLNAEYVVAYHPSFADTLLGLRLFQADCYILDPEISGELPRNKRGYLLGRSEAEPVPAAWRNAAAQLNHILVKGEAFRAYVICDYGVSIGFAPAHKYLDLTGVPYFWFWAKGKDQIEEVIVDGRRIRIMNSFEVIHLKDLSAEFSRQEDLLRASNPAVYAALVNTMRYAALFRYCRIQDQQTWERFRASLKQVELSPELRTPTIMTRRDNVNKNAPRIALPAEKAPSRERE